MTYSHSVASEREGVVDGTDVGATERRDGHMVGLQIKDGALLRTYVGDNEGRRLGSSVGVPVG
jgi:hypothetical protein